MNESLVCEEERALSNGTLLFQGATGPAFAFFILFVEVITERLFCDFSLSE